jgi:hypothetical protein
MRRSAQAAINWEFPNKKKAERQAQIDGQAGRALGGFARRFARSVV